MGKKTDTNANRSNLPDRIEDENFDPARTQRERRGQPADFRHR
jgi:hypothetical protein